jgi:DNA-binding LacI/PurR family transcriptional regulator
VKEAAHLAVLAEQRVQGVLITPTAELSPDLEALRARGIPLVLLDRRAPGPTSAPSPSTASWVGAPTRPRRRSAKQRGESVLRATQERLVEARETCVDQGLPPIRSVSVSRSTPTDSKAAAATPKLTG